MHEFTDGSAIHPTLGKTQPEKWPTHTPSEGDVVFASSTATTLDDLIDALQDAKYFIFKGNGEAAVLITTPDGVAFPTLRATDTDAGTVLMIDPVAPSDMNDAGPDAGDESNDVNVSVDDEDDEDDVDKSLLEKVISIGRVIHDDDVPEILHARTEDPEIYELATVAEGFVASSLEEYPDTDEGWRDAGNAAIRLKQHYGLRGRSSRFKEWARKLSER